MSDRDDWTREPIQSLERDVGIRAGFLTDLLREGDDWSFVIKLHALFEAALAQCLAKELGHLGLVDVFSYMELSNAKAGKVAIGKALGLFSKRERRFLRSLSELRNKLVHDVTNTDFTFQAYVADLDLKKREHFYESFEIDVESDTIEVAGRHVSRAEFFLANPRLMIWVAAAVVLSHLYLHAKGTQLERELSAQYADLPGLMMSPVAPPSVDGA